MLVLALRLVIHGGHTKKTQNDRLYDRPYAPATTKKKDVVTRRLRVHDRRSVADGMSQPIKRKGKGKGRVLSYIALLTR